MNPPPVVPTVRPLSTSAAAKLDAAGNVAVDVACRRCGYNLRTLPSVGKCPECGTAVGRSLHGDLLQFSDPEWVEKLAGGMNWIVASIIIGFFSGIIAIIVGTVLGGFNNPNIVNTAVAVAQLGFGAIGLIGYWKVTTPDPAKLEPESPASPRTIVRMAKVFNYAAAPIAQTLMIPATLIALAISTVSGIVGIVAIFAIFLYARVLALRIPDDVLARQCRTVMWGLAIMSVGSVGTTAIMAYVAGGGAGPAVLATGGGTGAPATSPAAGQSGADSSGSLTKLGYVSQPTAPVGGASGTTTTTATATTATSPLTTGRSIFAAAIGCFIGLGSLIFGIWSILLIFRFRKAFAKAA